MESDFLIFQNQTIEEDIELIQSNESRCVILITDNYKIIGTISEGDILRALLKGINVKSLAKNIANLNFSYIKEKHENNDLKNLFNKGITLIPVITHDRKIIDAISYLDFFNER